jgi:transcriptional regulator with XRE-family HTH domain
MAQTLEQQIRRVIKQHYKDDLWTFRADANYREGTKAFVADIGQAIKGELEYASDLSNVLAKYTKASSIDRGFGGAIRKLRIKREIPIEQLAQIRGFDVGFLDALEQGRVVASADMYINTHKALKPTKAERKEFLSHITCDKRREEMIREVIELYYGISLWAYRPDLSYEEAIKPFVKSLAALSGGNRAKVLE